MMNQQRAARKLLIEGSWVDAVEGATITTIDPSTEEPLAELAAGTAADVDRAVAAARRAFDDGPWRGMAPTERAAIMHRLADLIDANADELSEIDVTDCGKPFAFVRDIDLPNMADLIRYMAGWATKLEGQTIPHSRLKPLEFLSYTRREPVGVVGQIIPWNGAALASVWKLAPALAAGCTVVLKPAEQASLAPLRIAELVCEAGFPDGVVNLVTGTGQVAGAAIAAHPQVDKVAFTGSVDTGRIILQAAAGNLKKLTLELGGKSPVAVYDDADLEAAIDGAVAAVFYGQGEACTAGSRLYVQESVYDEVLAGVIEKTRGLHIGPSMDRQNMIGPMISAQQRERVRGYVRGAVEQGAEILSGGGDVPSPGYFIEPTVVGRTTDDMDVVREEIFGPVVTVMSFRDTPDLIKRANDTRFGLSAGVWTRDMGRAHRFAAGVNAGAVWINSYNVFDAALPFGGFKESGWGKEMGGAALEGYLQTKAITLAL